MQLSSAFADDILCSSGEIGIRGRFKLCFLRVQLPAGVPFLKLTQGGDFVNNISAVAIGKLIAAHREGDEQKFKTYVDFIANKHQPQVD